MKEMVLFSLNRRFNNKSTKIFNTIVCVVMFCLCFSDKIMQMVNPSMFEEKIVYTIGIENEELAFLNENAKDVYVFKNTAKNAKTIAKDGNLVLEKREGYKLYSKYKNDEILIPNFELYLNLYRKNKILENSDNVELLLLYQQDIQVESIVLDKKVDLTQEKSNLIFMFVSGIYFMMISFVSTVASEVVNEKATKTLELILTSVDAKIHFYAKVLVGWLVIVIQGCLSLSYLLVSLILRNAYDQGNGLIAFIRMLHLADIEGETFYTVIKNMNLSLLFFEKLTITMIFLALGILLVQLMMVIVSSFVSSVEEAGNIQAPFYLVLLGIYYLVMAINNPYDLNEGIGFYLSFVPLINMLLMPCRLLISDVPMTQLLVSMGGSLLFVLYIVHKGIPIYERGVLDYSCKGFVQVLKSMRQGKMTFKEKKKRVANALKKYRK